MKKLLLFSSIKDGRGKFLVEARKTLTPKGSGGIEINQRLLIPVLAIITGLIFGAFFIILTTEQVYFAFGQSIGEGLRASWKTIAQAYGALFVGAIGDPVRILAALQSGDALEIRESFYPIFESLLASTPYIFAGLAVALSFRAGVFNIGVEGQIFIGAITGTYIAYTLIGLPAIIHIPLSLMAGALGGALWAFIPGWLKAKTGAHEVINTIMMNYIAFRLTEWLLSGPMRRPGSGNPISPPIQASAALPRFFEDPIRFHLGFFIALAMAWVIYWLLFKTTLGFELRSIGANPNAARYAGMSVTKGVILAMAFSGALAGLAGINEVLGVNYSAAMAFSSGYGFDSIALALLGNNHPIGVVLAALLFGSLRNGATQMQIVSGIPIDIISILQAAILVFIAAPMIIRTLYRLRKPAFEEKGLTIKGWGGN